MQNARPSHRTWTPNHYPWTNVMRSSCGCRDTILQNRIASSLVLYFLLFVTLLWGIQLQVQVVCSCSERSAVPNALISTFGNWECRFASPGWKGQVGSDYTPVVCTWVEFESGREQEGIVIESLIKVQRQYYYISNNGWILLLSDAIVSCLDTYGHCAWWGGLVIRVRAGKNTEYSNAVTVTLITDST